MRAERVLAILDYIFLVLYGSLAAGALVGVLVLLRYVLTTW